MTKPDPKSTAPAAPPFTPSQPAPTPTPQPAAQPAATPAVEVGGRKGPEPTRYGDWERKGIAVDF